MKTAIQTRDAPEAIGTYSQGVRAGDTLYLSGQIGLDPATLQLAEGIEGQTHRVFRNLAAVAAAAARAGADALLGKDGFVAGLSEVLAQLFPLAA